MMIAQYCYIVNLLPTKRKNTIKLPPSASVFKKQDLAAMNVIFKPASSLTTVIPYNVESVNFPSKYIIKEINRTLLEAPGFNIKNLKETDSDVLTFISKLHDIIENSTVKIGTTETHTDALMDDIFRIVNLNSWPLKIKNRLPCKLHIKDKTVSSKPEFVIKIEDIDILVIEDKHLKNINSSNGYGETQIAVEMFACGSENIRSLGDVPTDQTLWAIRVISTYVTFYKATISAAYWQELADGLPEEQSVKIERWPAENNLTSGFDLAEPNGRKLVFIALVKLCELLFIELDHLQNK